MPLHVAITGSTGLIGTAVTDALHQAGHSLTPIIRSSTPVRTNKRVIRWKILSGEIDRDKFEGHDVIIHLAGANIADQRWSKEYKREIQESRVKGTRLLCNAIVHMKRPPRLWLSASAVGYYGNIPLNEHRDETGPGADDFLARVCQEWEEATKPAQSAGIRVVNLRFGMVVSPNGGAIKKMLPVFKLGLGGKLGSGQQSVSWIALDEIPKIILHIIDNAKIAGPVNVVAPKPVTNAELTQLLGKALNRPAFLSVPEFAVKFMFGEMGQTLLLGNSNVIPAKLAHSGYQFAYPDIRKVLENCINHSPLAH